MALVVGTNTYISVADAKTKALTLSDKGKQFTNLSTAQIEEALTYALTNIEELALDGKKKSSGQTLQFPRAFYAVGDTNGLKLVQTVQVWEAIEIAFGNQRQQDRRIIIDNNMALGEMDTYCPLASVAGFSILEGAGYYKVAAPAIGNRMISNRRSNVRELPSIL